MQPMAGQANFMSAAGNVKYRRIMLSVAFGHLGVHSRPGTHMWLQGGDRGVWAATTCQPWLACVIIGGWD